MANSKEMLLTELNNYKGDNFWEDVVLNYRDIIDEARTEEIDPGGRSDIIMLTDGSKVIWENNQWVKGRSEMLKDIQSSAAALYDGGWRSTDREQLIQEYLLTTEEVDALCRELERIDNKETTI